MAKDDGTKSSVNSNGVPLFKSDVTKLDVQLDKEIVYEFGGPVGVCGMMIGFPLLLCYFALCLILHDGHFFYPEAFTVEAFKQWFWVEIVGNGVPVLMPTVKAAKIYLGYVAFSFVLAYIMPGPVVHGLPIPSLKGKRLPYLCNGLSAWYLTLVTAAVLHVTGVFRLTEIIDNFGPIMTVAIMWGFTMTTLVYVCSIINGTQHRMSGNFFYDFFMGAPVNPRIGHVDLKMWAETRVPWPILFFISVSCLLKQYELTGQITGPQAFMVLAYFLYANSCQKGEECIPTSWDMFYEKDGFMLIFWNMAGVPFSYCYGSIYLISHQLSQGTPITHSLPYTVFVYLMLLTAYYVFDTANAQKNRFRMEQNGSFMTRNAFPQLPWGHIKNPTYIKTAHGNLLLTSGWWGMLRKPHYTADLFQAMSWGLITGTGSFLPYFYLCFFIVVLNHRVFRDMERCAKKYGKDWDRYCERVPYVFIPYVF